MDRETEAQESLPDSATQPCRGSELWTKRRVAIRKWLEGTAPSLGELYRGVVELFGDPSFPRRIRFLAHGVRDIANRLPDCVAGYERPPRMQYVQRLEALSKKWDRNGPRISVGDPVAVDATAEISVSATIVREIDVLVADHQDSRKTVTSAATRLFEALAPENEAAPEELRPVIRQWEQITGWFVGHAHDPGKVVRIDEKKLQHKFELFENTLASLIEAFYEPVDDLDDILEDTNS